MEFENVNNHNKKSFLIDLKRKQKVYSHFFSVNLIYDDIFK